MNVLDLLPFSWLAVNVNGWKRTSPFRSALTVCTGTPTARSLSNSWNWKSVSFAWLASALSNVLRAVRLTVTSFGAYVFVNWMASDWTPSHVVLAVMRRVNVVKSSVTVTVRTHVRSS